MSVAFDISFQWASVSPRDVVDAGGSGVLVYSGAARPDDWWCDQMRAAGLELVWIFEAATDRALAGYQAGGVDCIAHERRIPAGELSYVVACDLNNGALAGRDVTAYLHGWGDTTREATFGQYGSSDAIEQGMTVGGKLQRFWGVVNWCPVGKPDNHPDNIAWWENLGVHLIQLIGTDIPGTDTNQIVKPDWCDLITSGDDMATWKDWTQDERDDFGRFMDLHQKSVLDSEAGSSPGITGFGPHVREILAVARKTYNAVHAVGEKLGVTFGKDA